jgi:hypothetical protein
MTVKHQGEAKPNKTGWWGTTSRPILPRHGTAKHRDHFEHVYRLHQLAQDSLGKYRGFTAHHYYFPRCSNHSFRCLAHASALD